MTARIVSISTLDYKQTGIFPACEVEGNYIGPTTGTASLLTLKASLTASSKLPSSRCFLSSEPGATTRGPVCCSSSRQIALRSAWSSLCESSSQRLTFRSSRSRGHLPPGTAQTLQAATSTRSPWFVILSIISGFQEGDQMMRRCCLLLSRAGLDFFVQVVDLYSLLIPDRCPIGLHGLVNGSARNPGFTETRCAAKTCSQTETKQSFLTSLCTSTKRFVAVSSGDRQLNQSLTCPIYLCLRGFLQSFGIRRVTPGILNI